MGRETPQPVSPLIHRRFTGSTPWASTCCRRSAPRRQRRNARRRRKRCAGCAVLTATAGPSPEAQQQASAVLNRSAGGTTGAAAATAVGTAARTRVASTAANPTQRRIACPRVGPNHGGRFSDRRRIGAAHGAQVGGASSRWRAEHLNPSPSPGAFKSALRGVHNQHWPDTPRLQRSSRGGHTTPQAPPQRAERHPPLGFSPRARTARTRRQGHHRYEAAKQELQRESASRTPEAQGQEPD